MKQLKVMRVAMKARAEKVLEAEESEIRALEERVIERIKKATKS